MALRRLRTLYFAEGVDDQCQTASRHNTGVQLLQRTGRGISRVCKRFFPFGDAFGIRAFEVFNRQVNFTAHFQQLWKRSTFSAPAQPQRREAANRP